MKIHKFNASRGATSGILLILGVILLIVIVGVFVVIKINSSRNAKVEEPVSNEPPAPVYEAKLGDVRFIFQSSADIGPVLVSQNTSYRQDLTTTERFVRVVIGAQNKGKENIKQNTWNLGNIIDSEGRTFIPVNQESQTVYFSRNNRVCGALLKPEFEPIPCEKYYEVSKESKDLKVEVYITEANSTKKKEIALLDLIVN